MSIIDLSTRTRGEDLAFNERMWQLRLIQSPLRSALVFRTWISCVSAPRRQMRPNRTVDFKRGVSCSPLYEGSSIVRKKC